MIFNLIYLFFSKMTHKSYMEQEFADMNGLSSFLCIKNMGVDTKAMTLASIET